MLVAGVVELAPPAELFWYLAKNESVRSPDAAGTPVKSTTRTVNVIGVVSGVALAWNTIEPAPADETDHVPPPPDPELPVA